MSRLTLRLPQTLHRQLKEQAHEEGISLNQYIVYSLTRQVAPAYMIYARSEEDIAQQEARFKALRESLRKGSDEEIDNFLAEREAEREATQADYDGLPSEMVSQLQQRIKAAREAAKQPHAS